MVSLNRDQKHVSTNDTRIILRAKSMNARIHEIRLKSNRTGCAVWSMGERGISGLFYHKISREYIAIILDFYNNRIFSRAFVYILSFSGCSAMSTKEQTMNIEQRIKRKFLVRLGKNSIASTVGNFYQEKMYGIFNAYFLFVFQCLWFRVLLCK